ncbi:MAG: GYF domain-containing protein [Limisphaerales bacterium]
MYKIVGGDGQEYGPVTDEDLRKWIAEGRLNADSLSKTESDANYRPLSTFAEFAEALRTAAAAFGVPLPPAPAVDWSSRDYELDIGGCISRGWVLFKDNAGLLFGSSILCLLLIVFVSALLGAVFGAVLLAAVSREAQQTVSFQLSRDFVSRIITSLFFGPLFAGLYYIFIQTMRGRLAAVAGLFEGFHRMFLHLFLGFLVYTMVAFFCLAPFSAVLLSRMMPLMAQFQHGPTPPAQAVAAMEEIFKSVAGSLPLLAVCLVPTIYLLTNLQFVLPLIIDKEMDFWTAIKTSWRMAHKHWFTVFGLMLMIWLINVAGFCLCVIPALFTFPITTAAFIYAYETIFCERTA